MQDTATHSAAQDPLAQAREALAQERRNVESMRLDLVNRQADRTVIEYAQRIDIERERSWEEWQRKLIRNTKKRNMKRTKFLRAKVKEFEAREALLAAREADLDAREADLAARENKARNNKAPPQSPNSDRR